MATEEGSSRTTRSIYNNISTLTAPNGLKAVRPSVEDWRLINYTDLSRVIDIEDLDLDLSQNSQLGSVPWSRLPPEILTIIFSFLDLRDKESVEQTCQSWNQSCQSPWLWREMTFCFNGIDSQNVVTDAYRLIEKKGVYLRSLCVKVGIPSLTKAWVISQCVQLLLEYVTIHPSSQNIEHFSLKNIDFSRDWRFFTVSTNNIIRALTNFLSRQKTLRSIDFTSFRLNAPNGMRILRTLKMSPSRHTVEKIDLHGFFQRHYRAVNGCRFSILLYASMFHLQELSIDARHLNDRTLQRLTERSVYRRRLKLLTIFFQASRNVATDSFISKQCWRETMEACPELCVTAHVGEWLPRSCIRTLFSEAMPLTKCIVYWSPVRKRRYSARPDLAFLIRDLGERFPSMLEGFVLDSRIKSNHEVDAAILFMVNTCRYLTDIRIAMDNMFSIVRDRIVQIASERHAKVRVSISKGRRW